jgi:hypothetical protein
MSTENDFLVRDFNPFADYEMVCDWWEFHGHPVVPANLLPPCGFVAGQDGTDMVALWIYFDSYTPVCFAERVVTAPGLSLAQVRGAVTAAGAAAQEAARNFGYTVMMMRVPQAIARYADGRLGFRVDEREIVNMSCVLQEEEEPCLF